MFTAAASSTLLRFSGVGAVGFVVDALVFFFVVNGLHANWAAARALAFLCAVGVTWQGNRRVTFGSNASPRGESVRYLAVQCGGCLVNYGAFVACAKILDPGGWLVVPYLAGTAAGMIFNYTLSRCFVFRPR